MKSAADMLGHVVEVEMLRTASLAMLAAASIALLPDGRPGHAGEPVAQEAAASQAGDAAVGEVDRRYQGRTIAEWIGDLGDNRPRGDAKRALAAIGAPAVDELARLIRERHKDSGFAIDMLAGMGVQARGALPTLLELAEDRQARDPDGWRWGLPIRAMLFSNVKDMRWAADQWIPVLRRAAEDPSESAVVRRNAIFGLGGMGADAKPILQGLAENDDDEVRKTANAVLAPISGMGTQGYYLALVERNPFDPNVPDYLVRLKDRYNHGQFHPPTQRVKAALRERLAGQPDAKTAWVLATIIRNGLANSDLMFSAPSDSVRSMWDREDPAESFTTLAEALEVCLEHAPQDSDLAQRAGLSLARLRLLQGDWEGMNLMLERLGQEPIPAADRAWLPAPPPDWSQLRDDWQPADESMRSGDCAIEFQFEKRGAGLAGAHVLIKRAPRRRAARFTGIDVDTLLHATGPLDAPPYDPFGYYARDRAMTRYGVSDANGKIRIEGLPKAPIRVEILIPMGNFAERWPSWELFMETVPGEFRTTTWGRPGSLSRHDGPAVVQLQEGATVQYPKLIVRPIRLGGRTMSR
jgi:hypothetical protein